MWGFPSGSMVKNAPAVKETRVRYLGWENPQEKGMAIHSSVLVWRIPWTRSLVGYSPWVAKSWTRLKQQSRHAYGMYKFKNHLHHLKRKLWSPLAVVPHPSPQSLPTTNLLSVSVDFLFWIFRVSGTTLCVSCCGFLH